MDASTSCTSIRNRLKQSKSKNSLGVKNRNIADRKSSPQAREQASSSPSKFSDASTSCTSIGDLSKLNQSKNSLGVKNRNIADGKASPQNFNSPDAGTSKTKSRSQNAVAHAKRDTVQSHKIACEKLNMKLFEKQTDGRLRCDASCKELDQQGSSDKRNFKPAAEKPGSVYKARSKSTSHGIVKGTSKSSRFSEPGDLSQRRSEYNFDFLKNLESSINRKSLAIRKFDINDLAVPEPLSAAGNRDNYRLCRSHTFSVQNRLSESKKSQRLENRRRPSTASMPVKLQPKEGPPLKVTFERNLVSYPKEISEINSKKLPTSSSRAFEQKAIARCHKPIMPSSSTSSRSASQDSFVAARFAKIDPNRRGSRHSSVIPTTDHYATYKTRMNTDEASEIEESIYVNPNAVASYAAKKNSTSSSVTRAVGSKRLIEGSKFKDTRPESSDGLPKDITWSQMLTLQSIVTEVLEEPHLNLSPREQSSGQRPQWSMQLKACSLKEPDWKEANTQRKMPATSSMLDIDSKSDFNEQSSTLDVSVTPHPRESGSKSDSHESTSTSSIQENANASSLRELESKSDSSKKSSHNAPSNVSTSKCAQETRKPVSIALKLAQLVRKYNEETKEKSKTSLISKSSSPRPVSSDSRELRSSQSRKASEETTSPRSSDLNVSTVSGNPNAQSSPCIEPHRRVRFNIDRCIQQPCFAENSSEAGKLSAESNRAAIENPRFTTAADTPTESETSFKSTTSSNQSLRLITRRARQNELSDTSSERLYNLHIPSPGRLGDTPCPVNSLVFSFDRKPQTEIVGRTLRVSLSSDLNTDDTSKEVVSSDELPNHLTDKTPEEWNPDVSQQRARAASIVSQRTPTHLEIGDISETDRLSEEEVPDLWSELDSQTEEEGDQETKKVTVEVPMEMESEMSIPRQGLSSTESSSKEELKNAASLHETEVKSVPKCKDSVPKQPIFKSRIPVLCKGFSRMRRLLKTTQGTLTPDEVHAILSSAFKMPNTNEAGDTSDLTLCQSDSSREAKRASANVPSGAIAAVQRGNILSPKTSLTTIRVVSRSLQQEISKTSCYQAKETLVKTRENWTLSATSVRTSITANSSVKTQEIPMSTSDMETITGNPDVPELEQLEAKSSAVSEETSANQESDDTEDTLETDSEGFKTSNEELIESEIIKEGPEATLAEDETDLKDLNALSEAAESDVAPDSTESTESDSISGYKSCHSTLSKISSITLAHPKSLKEKPVNSKALGVDVKSCLAESETDSDSDFPVFRGCNCMLPFYEEVKKIHDAGKKRRLPRVTSSSPLLSDPLSSNSPSANPSLTIDEAIQLQSFTHDTQEAVELWRDGAGLLRPKRTVK